MRKDSAKNDSTTKRVSLWRSGLRLILLASVTGAFCGAIFFAYQHKVLSPYYPVVGAYFSRLSTWVGERKHHLQDDLVKVKQFAVTKNNTEQEIHFEFYTALPNMQVSVSEPASKEVNDDKVKAIKKSPSIKSVAAKKSVISIEEIENELEAHVNKKNQSTSEYE